MTTDPFTLFDDWYEQARLDRKSTRLNSIPYCSSRIPSSSFLKKKQPKKTKRNDKISTNNTIIQSDRITRYHQNRIRISHLVPYCLEQFTPAPVGDRSFRLQAPAPRRPLLDSSATTP